MSTEHQYFFEINLYNSFDIIPDLFATLFHVAVALGRHNVYVFIYENGSTDQPKALLRIFDALTRSVGPHAHAHAPRSTTASSTSPRCTTPLLCRCTSCATPRPSSSTRSSS
ncbi:hypothetical protein FB451DRAFT_187042 [Mycena latifolia]|nr:hypothetical protein FB451DRAFT_187042 [Mycena latifolia]